MGAAVFCVVVMLDVAVALLFHGGLFSVRVSLGDAAMKPIFMVLSTWNLDLPVFGDTMGLDVPLAENATVAVVFPGDATEKNGSVLANSARRLEVVRNCIAYIFENKMLEAKKVSSSGPSDRNCLGDTPCVIIWNCILLFPAG